MSFLSALFITFFVSLLNILSVMVSYGSEGLDCSILFAQLTLIEKHIPYNITCCTLLICQIMLAFTGTASVAVIIMTAGFILSRRIFAKHEVS